MADERRPPHTPDGVFRTVAQASTPVDSIVRQAFHPPLVRLAMADEDGPPHTSDGVFSTVAQASTKASQKKTVRDRVESGERVEIST
jgi:hypothetical protein